MERDLLSKVIAAEKDIQDCLDSEKTKACKWLEEVREEAEEEILREQEKMQSLLEEKRNAAVNEANLRASEILNRAREAAGRIEGVDGVLLRKIVLEHLNKILPE